jgi:hypothetical protein
VQGRLSTCDANPVNPISKGAEAIEDIFKWNRRISLRVENERVVMAIGTAKVAMGKEDH